MRSHIISSIMAVTLLATAHSHALTLTDGNSNGMSDYWEKHWNNGAVFPSSFSPTADPDGDGWNNLTESVAGTNPKDPQPPTGLVQVKIIESPTVEGDPTDAPKAFVISWPTIIGKQYKLMVSSDLSPGSWVLFDQPMMGTGAEIQIAVESLNEDGTRPQRLFWRVAADDTDTDGDTLSDYEEAAKGTNPLSGDTDGDGIADNIDSTPTISNAVANPDGAGLVNAQNAPLSIANGMIGRWDFENTLPYSPPAGSSQQPFYYPDSTSNGRKAVIYNTFSTNPEGMVSKAYDNENGSFLSFPNDLIGNRTVYSVSFWAMIKQGAVSTTTAGNPVGLFSHHYRYTAWKMINGVKSYTGRYTDYINGVWIEKKSATEELLRAGSHIYRSHDDSNNNINPPIVIDNGLKITRPLGSSDDGKWHQYTFVVNGSNVTLYIDGVPLGTNGDGVNAIDNGEFSSISLGRLNGQSPTGTYASGNGLSVTATRARFDRLRLYSRVINASEAKMLAQEDTDHDGLWDVTENATRLWRDTNSDGISTPGERQYMVSPFIAQPAEGDADGDGLPNLIEQNIGTGIANPDTDGDFMPDGWEYQYSSMAGTSSLMMAAAAAPTIGYLNPLVADAAGDLDGDGVNNLNEYRYAANPRSQDSDGDGKNDNIEIGQNSNPSDPSDGGNPIPPAERLSILLGVGDQSGSQSEDYIMNCFRIDPESGEEKRVYTLRSGGFGEYKEETQSIFKKGETYTFQIDWQGSKLTSRASSPGVSAEGPDFDYTFKVEPQGTGNGIPIDGWNKSNSSVESAILAVDASDVASTEAEFSEKYESKRFALVCPKMEWLEDDETTPLPFNADPASNQLKGRKAYPDKNDPDDSRTHFVKRLKISGALPKSKLFVKSFDVDDTTSDEVIDPNDGSAGGVGDDNYPDHISTPKAGQFIATSSDNQQVNLDESGHALLKFRIGLQPGNNYRVAVSDKKDSLDLIQTQTTNALGYLSPDNFTATSSGTCIPGELLTVWRRLWVENDSMSSEDVNSGSEKNYLDVEIRSVSSTSPIPGGGSVYVAQTIDSHEDFYSYGRLRPNNQQQWWSVYKTVKSPGTILTHTVPTSIGGWAKLYDDDGRGLTGNQLPRLDLINDELKSYFKPAFIDVINAQAYNNNKIVSFKKNEDVYSNSTVIGHAKDLIDTPYNWCCTIVAAFQGLEDADGDPEGANESRGCGDTAEIGENEISAVYVETCRETFSDKFKSDDETYLAPWRIRYNRMITAVLAHEMGHHPADNSAEADHAEGKIMTEGMASQDLLNFTTTFSNKTLKRFRECEQWSN